MLAVKGGNALHYREGELSGRGMFGGNMSRGNIRIPFDHTGRLPSVYNFLNYLSAYASYQFCAF